MADPLRRNTPVGIRPAGIYTEHQQESDAERARHNKAIEQHQKAQEQIAKDVQTAREQQTRINQQKLEIDLEAGLFKQRMTLLTQQMEKEALTRLSKLDPKDIRSLSTRTLIAAEFPMDKLGDSTKEAFKLWDDTFKTTAAKAEAEQAKRAAQAAERTQAEAAAKANGLVPVRSSTGPSGTTTTMALPPVVKPGVAPEKVATNKLTDIDKRLKAEYGVGLSQFQNPDVKMRRVNPAIVQDQGAMGDKDNRSDNNGSHYAFDVKEKNGDTRTVTIPMDRYKSYADEYQQAIAPAATAVAPAVPSAIPTTPAVPASAPATTPTPVITTGESPTAPKIPIYSARPGALTVDEVPDAPKIASKADFDALPDGAVGNYGGKIIWKPVKAAAPEPVASAADDRGQ